MNFYPKFWMCFFQGQTLYCPYLRNGWSDWCAMKWSASVGYWVSYVTLTFDLIHDLDLRFFKIKFRNSCISGFVGMIDVKWPWSFRVEVWNSLIPGIGVRKRFESSIHDHDIDLCVTMVVWMDVSDSDWGDFRRRHAIDISSSIWMHTNSVWNSVKKIIGPHALNLKS